MDIRIHYIEEGHGSPLLMIHGNGECGEYFRPQIEYFKDRYRCICPDSRAHGETPRGTEPLTIRQMAADMVAFMDELGIAKADILGFSDGANIALIMAMKYPERIGKLISDGANLDPSGVDAETNEMIISDYNEALAKSEFSRKHRIEAEIINLMIDDPAINPDDLEQIKCETLVLAGTEDVILREHTELIASRIPNSRLVFIEGDHFCSAENPEEFNRACDKFLGCLRVQASCSI